MIPAEYNPHKSPGAPAILGFHLTHLQPVSQVKFRAFFFKIAYESEVCGFQGSSSPRHSTVAGMNLLQHRQTLTGRRDFMNTFIVTSVTFLFSPAYTKELKSTPQRIPNGEERCLRPCCYFLRILARRNILDGLHTPRKGSNRSSTAGAGGMRLSLRNFELSGRWRQVHRLWSSHSIQGVQCPVHAWRPEVVNTHCTNPSGFIPAAKRQSGRQRREP